MCRCWSAFCKLRRGGPLQILSYVCALASLVLCPENSSPSDFLVLPAPSCELWEPARLYLMAFPSRWLWANLACFSFLRNHFPLLTSNFWKSSFHGFCPLFSTSHLDWKWKSLCDPMDFSPPSFSVHGDSPGRNIEVGCHALLQGIFLTQGYNPGLPHCRQILYHLSHQGSPQIYYLY